METVFGSARWPGTEASHMLKRKSESVSGLLLSEGRCLKERERRGGGEKEDAETQPSKGLLAM